MQRQIERHPAAQERRQRIIRLLNRQRLMIHIHQNRGIDRHPIVLQPGVHLRALILFVNRHRFAHHIVIPAVLLRRHHHRFSLVQGPLQLPVLALVKPARIDHNHRVRIVRHARVLRQIHPAHIVLFNPQQTLQRLVRIVRLRHRAAHLLIELPDMGRNVEGILRRHHRHHRLFGPAQLVDDVHQAVLKCLQVLGQDAGQDFYVLVFVPHPKGRIH